MDNRQFRVIVALLGMIGVALLALVLVLLFSGGDGEPNAAPETTPGVPTSLPPAAATTVPTPTQPPATTASTLPPVTTAPASTTEAPLPTTDAPPPSTTEPPPTLLLQDDGIGGVPFGTAPADSIAFAESVLGPAKNDTGWIDSFSKYGTCPGDVVRGVEWGGEDTGFGFVLLFTQEPTDFLPGGGPHLFGYYYYGDPPGLTTEGGVTVGSTLGEAQSAHPGSVVEEHPLVVGSAIWSVDDDPGDDALLWGFAGGLSDDDTLTSINGGVTCGE